MRRNGRHGVHAAVDWRWKTTLVLAAAVALVLAAPASATTYCVNEPECVQAGGKQERAQADEEWGKVLAKALKAASTSTGPSTVVVGAGTYTRENGFSYAGAEAVSIRGAGEGKTVLSAGAKSTEKAGAVFVLASADSTLAGVSIEVPEGEEPIGLLLHAGTAEDVAIVAEGAGAQADHPTGLSLAAGAFRAGSIELPTTGDSIGVRFEGGGEVLGSTIVAHAGAAGTPPETLRGCRVSATSDDVEDSGGALTVEDSLLDMRGGTGAAVSVAGIAGVHAEATLRGLTIVNGGAGSDGLLVQAVEGASSTAVLESSVIADVAVPILERAEGAGSQATSSSDYSSYESEKDEQEGPVGEEPAPPREEHEIAGQPGFVSTVLGENGFSEGNWHPALGSPLLDAGTPSPLAGGEYAFDAEGNPRITLARRAVGALEWRAPVVTASASTATATVGQTVTFSGGASLLEPGDTVTGYQWSFDGGPVAATGESATHAFATSGPHTATLTAEDVLGVKGSATVQVEVKLAISGTPLSGKYSLGGLRLGDLGSRGRGSSTALASPLLSGLRLAPRSFHAARSGASITSNRRIGTRVAFSLSKATTVLFAAERLVGGFTYDGRCVASRHGTRAKRCTRRVRMKGGFSRYEQAGARSLRFSGRLAGHALHRGRYLLVASVKGSTRKPLTTPFTVLR